MKFLWPSIDDLEDAQKACKTAASCSFFVCIVTGIIAFLAVRGTTIIPGISAANFLDAAIFGVLGFLLLRHSRLAAIAALLLYGGGQVLMMQQSGPRFNLLAIFFVLYFIGGVRGAFAYHEMKKNYEGEAAVKSNPLVTALITMIGLVLIGGIGWVLFPQIMAAKTGHGGRPQARTAQEARASKAKTFSLPFKMPTFKMPAGPGKTAVSGSGIPTVSAAPRPGERTFKLSNGQTVTGYVTQEDDVYYTVATSGGRQEIVIKEDIAQEGAG